MSGDDAANASFLLVALMLPLAGLVARKLPIGTVARMALAWVAIFAAGYVLVMLGRDSVPRLWHRATAAIGGEDQAIRGDTVRVRMAEDGHFWAQATINGMPRRMLIDSGATTTALSARTAQAAGLDLEESTFPTILDTANGRIAARVSTVPRLRIGSIEARDLGIVVSPAFGDTDVIGMNFLSRLGSWRVEGNVLILQPPADQR